MGAVGSAFTLQVFDMDGRAQFRTRRKFTSPGQKRLLEFVYSVYPKPSKEFQRYLADLLGMEVKRVRVWFQNKRTRGSATGKHIVANEREVHEKMRAEIGELLAEFEAARKAERSQGQRLPIMPLRAESGTQVSPQMAYGRLGRPPVGTRPEPSHAQPRLAPAQGTRFPAVGQQTTGNSSQEEAEIDFAVMNRIIVAVLNGNPAALKEVLQLSELRQHAQSYLNYSDDRVNVLNSASSTASFRDYATLMRVLLDHGLDPFHPAHKGALHYAVLIHAHRALQFLLELLVPASVRDSALDTPLHVAAKTGDEVSARLLLEYKAQVDALNAKSETPLHVALRYGSLPVAHVLIAAGADVNSRTGSGDSCLHLAFRSSREPLARFLLQHKPRLDVINTALDSPLHELMGSSFSSQDKLALLYVACQSLANDDEQVARVLQLRNCDGETLLHVACIAGDEKLVEVLLQYGFDPAARTFSGVKKRSAGLDAMTIARDLGWSAAQKAITSFLHKQEKTIAVSPDPPVTLQVS